MVRRSHELEEVPIGVVEVDATAAVPVVDLSRLAATRVGVRGYVAVEEPAVSGVKGGVVDQEGNVHRPDICGIVSRGRRGRSVTAGSGPRVRQGVGVQNVI